MQGGSLNVREPPRPRDFQRVYKACESCRKKKTRCVLDPLGNRDGGPCGRCKREFRECVFSVDRSHRRRGSRDWSPRESPRRGVGESPTNDEQWPPLLIHPQEKNQAFLCNLNQRKGKMSLFPVSWQKTRNIGCHGPRPSSKMNAQGCPSQSPERLSQRSVDRHSRPVAPSALFGAMA
jgi:hypothetical protein